MPEPTQSSGPETWLTDLFDSFFEDLLEGRNTGPEQAISAHPELEDRIRELFELALRLSGHRPPATLQCEGYTILSELGRGGMGTVYLARHEALARTVALKVLPPSLAMSEVASRRFLNEARAMARVEDEHIVRIYEIVERPDLLALAMEWIDGLSLRQLIDELRPRGRDASLGDLALSLGAREEQLPGRSRLQFLVHCGIRIARALAKVHAAGIVHRDVKPSNILIRRDGTPLLADFGLARGSDVSLTQSHAFVGTPVYAAPEQLRSDRERIDARTDVYALGVTLYEAIAFAVPFRGRDTTELLRQIEIGDVPPLRRGAPGVPRDLETIVHKAMEPDPDHRYATAADLADDLERLLHLKPIRARPVGMVRRAAKLVRRHRRPITAAAVGALGLGLLLAVADYHERGRLADQQQAAALVRAARLHLLSAERQEWAWTQVALGQVWVDSPLGKPAIPSPPGLIEAAAKYRQAMELDSSQSAIESEHAIVALCIDVADPGAALDILRARGGVMNRVADELASTRRLPALDSGALARAPPGSRSAIGLLAFLIGDVAVCEQAWELLDHEEFPLVDPALGMVYLADGRPERAYPRLERALAAFPESRLLRAELADAALSVGDFGRAEVILGDIAEGAGSSSPDDIGLRRIRADLLVSQGRLEEATREYLSLAEQHPGQPTPHHRLAELDLRAGRVRAAIRRLEELVARYPTAARYRRALAEAALHAGDLPAGDIARYLRQARYVVRVGFGSGRSPGTIRDLLEILRIGGLRGLFARGVVANGHRPPVSSPVACLSFPAAARHLLDVAEAEALLTALAAFDRDAEEHFEIRLTSEPARRFAETLAVATNSAVRLPRALHLALRPPSALLCRAAALSCRAGWRELTARHLPAIFTAVGLAPVPDAELVSRHLLTVTGEAFGDMFGCVYSNDLVPDVDGDGCADLVVGAPQSMCKPVGPGYARLFSGADGRILKTWVGDAAGDAFGWSVAAAGDVDGDGCEDVIVGAIRGGYARVFSCRTGERIWSRPDARGTGFGWAVDGVGDVDQDGHDDLVVSAATDHRGAGPYSGSVQVLSGRDGAVLVTLLGAAAYDTFGRDVSQAGDLDGDGFPDVVVGACGTDVEGWLSGRVHVYSGKWIATREGDPLLHTWHGEPGDRMGHRVSDAGDVDGDGCPDIVVGASRANGATGYVRVYSGRTFDEIWTLAGSRPLARLGVSVCGAGDVDGDGRDDIVVGSGEHPGGSVALISGRDRTLLLSCVGVGADDSAAFVAGGEDVDGDGWPDILVGGSQSDVDFGVAYGVGYARVYSGR